jgi:hypothetical protein
MFWKRGPREATRDRPEESETEQYGPIQIERDAERPATILRVATELERRGAEIVELFKEIETEHARTVFPIHLRWKEQDFFVEIETRRWRSSTVDKALKAAAALRRSEHAESGLGLLSAYPAPEEVLFFFEKSPAALFQLDLYAEGPEGPEESAAAFVRAVRRRWNTDLDYDLDSLRAAEAKLLESRRDAKSGTSRNEDSPPILDAAAEGLGYYLGEVLRRDSGLRGGWIPAEDWGEALVLKLGVFNLDPVGKARAFLRNGAKDSVAYYTGYALEELKAVAPAPGNQP